MKIFALLCLLALPAAAATYYVDKSGNDANAGSIGSPWLTIGKANTVLTAGDTVMIGDGDYVEHIHETTSGSAGALITYKAVNKWMASVRAFRLGGSYVKLDSLKIHKFSGVGNTWGAGVRIEPAADFGTITDCKFSDLPHVVAHDFRFPSANTIRSDTSNFISAGFVVGSKIYLGASGYTHPTTGPLFYANHDTTWEVSALTATTMTLTNGSAAWINDSGTGKWAFVRAGAGNSGYYAILGVESGGDSPQNWTITNNVIENWPGHAMNIDGDGFLLQGNSARDLKSFRWLSFSGSDHVIRRNIIRDCANVIHYTHSELDAIEHPPGTGWYDYQVAMLSGFSDAGNNQNVLIEENWFENIENQMGRVDDSHASTFGITYRKNVFIGVTDHFSGGRDGMKWDTNTYYKCAFGTAGHPLSIGGLEADAHTGYEVNGNLFVACGKKGLVETRTRGFYSIAPWATVALRNQNFVASEEVTGYLSKTNFSEVAGVNGGDPVFYDANDPDGADNIPFTDDDGLKVLANSPAATLGGGALGVRPVTTGQPVAHFRITAPTGWFEPDSDNYDPAWLAQLPTQRGGPQRPYTTPASIGEAPVATAFSADKSISGVAGASTNTAINQYTWSWGDGTANTVTSGPTAAHTFSAPGDYAVTLTVRNTGNATHSITNTYRVTGSAPGSGSVLTVPAQYATIQLAVNAAQPGDTVLVTPGTYTETVTTARSGTSDHKITIDGQNGAVFTRLVLAHDWVVTKRLTLKGALNQFLHHLWVNGADNNLIQDVKIDGDYKLKVYGLTFGPGKGSNNVFERVTIEEIRGYPMLELDGSNNEVRHCLVQNGYDVDFMRIFGNNHRIWGNIFQNNVKTPVELGSSGFHPDFVQTFGDNWSSSYGHIIERNIVRNAPAAQLTQLSATGHPDIRDWIFRNNLFMDIGLQGSCTVPGVQYINNVFYRCNLGNGGHALTFGRRPFKADDGLNANHPDHASTVNPTPSGSILPGAWYRVVVDATPLNGIVSGVTYKARTRNTGRVVYNSTEYSNGQTFVGTSNPNWTKGGLEADQAGVQLYVEGGITYNGALYLRAESASNDYIFQGVSGVTTFSSPAPQVKVYRVILDIADRTVVKNNVFLDCGNPTNNTNGWYAIDSRCSSVAANHNFVAKNGFKPVKLDTLARVVGGGVAWDSQSWWEPNGINGGNPGVTDFSSGDFRPQPGSVLIDAGQNLAGLVNDFFGTVRPLGVKTDIGLGEYDDGSPPPPPVDPPPPSPPAAPSGLNVISITDTSALVRWTDNATDELAFTLQRSVNGAPWTTTNIPAANVVSYELTGLTPSTLYYVRLAAANATGSSAYSSTVVFTTSEPPDPTPADPPAAPSGLTSTALGSHAVLLAWTNEIEDGELELVWSADGTSWGPPVRVLGTATAWPIPGLEPASPYYFRIRRKTTTGESAWSNTSATTTAAPAPLPKQTPKQSTTPVTPP